MLKASGREGLDPRIAVVALMAVAAVAAALLEVTVFNLNHWLTRGSQPYELAAVRTEQVDGTDVYVFDAPADLSLVQVSFQGEMAYNQLLDVTFWGSDQGQPGLHKLGEAEMWPYNPLTCIERLHFYGEPAAVGVSVEAGAGTETVFAAGSDAAVTGVSLTADPVVPRDLSPQRAGAVFAVIALALIVRRRGPLGATASQDPGLFRFATAGVTLVLVLGSAAVFFSKPAYTGIATGFYNQAYLEEGAAASTFSVEDVDQDPYSTNRYFELARAFAAGRTSLLIDPPAWMRELDNPYDRAQRQEMVDRTGEYYLWDCAYYDGSYYVYFGVLPALVFYLPFYLLTGATFPGGVAVMTCCAAFTAGLAALLFRIARRWFPATRISTFVLVLAGAWASSALVFAFARAAVYELPMTMGMALAVWSLWALAGAMERMGDPRSQMPWYAAASTLVALTFASRPQLGIVLLAFIPALAVQARRDRITPGIAACVAAPLAVVAAALMAYNAARFGSPFDFGANYNLTTNDMRRRPRSILMELQGLFSYILQPANISARFPYLLPADAQTGYVGSMVTEPGFGGVFALAPFTLAGLVAMALADRRRVWAGIAGGLVACAVVVAAFDTMGAGILGRYDLDFFFLFALAAALGFLSFERSRGHKVSRALLSGGVGATMLMGGLLLLAMFSHEGRSTVGFFLFDARTWADLSAAFTLL